MKNLKQLYVDNLVSHFIDFMNHLIIIMINEIRNEYGDEYDAMSDWKCKHPNIVVLCQGVSTEQTIRKKDPFALHEPGETAEECTASRKNIWIQLCPDWYGRGVIFPRRVFK